MHDIGKVGIPDAILNAPRKLTADEFEIMKTHASLGYDMLKSSNKPILQAAAIVANEHHEKFDGSGYPNKTIGENIHIYGRITAVADVFDALGHERVYKHAWPLADILTLFKEQKGIHFEPRLINLLFHILEKFINIKNRFEEMILQKFGFKIFKFNIGDLRNDYRSPIMNEKIQVFDAYVGLDKLIMENINEEDLKGILKDVVNPNDLKEKRGLKLLELFFEHKLKIENPGSVISPLFIVHDLRILKAHLAVSSFDERYANCKRRLEVDNSLNHIDFF